MEGQFCFDCLRQRIRSDFSDELVFSYGISGSSSLPFGHRAAVKIPNPNGEGSTEFMLVYLPRQGDDCIAHYIDQHIVEDGQGIKNSANDSEEGVNGKLETSDSSEKRSLPGLKSDDSICDSPGHYFYSRRITAMAPCAHIGICSYEVLADLASSLLAGSLEDHVLHSLCLFIEGKPTNRAAKNFYNLIGIPSFDDVYIPGCLRHPNLDPVLAMVKASDYSCLVIPKVPYTLENILHFSPEALISDWHVRFLIYQLISALAYLHGLGVTHGSISPSNIYLTHSCWAWLSIFDNSEGSFSAKSENSKVSTMLSIRHCTEDCFSQDLYADLKLSPVADWPSEFYRWWRGELSNFEYLLVLNRLAGRKWGDHTFHTIMPWVIDFTAKPDENSDIGWRDLSKSKWRLAKGDEQLDFTYATSEIQHHVSDECLSELAVCSYKARRLPLSILCTAVRSVYEPNEYPSTMQRLYQWTPDECIPEFYCDPQIFSSVNPGMSDLAVPSWAESPEAFIKLHREALESLRVSREIHHWIDIIFGYKMSGEAAVSAKNVMLPSSDPTSARSIGRRQLFARPHPARQIVATITRDEVGPGTYNLCSNETENGKCFDIDNLQCLEEAAAFCEHARHLSPVYCYEPEDRKMKYSFIGDSVTTDVDHSSEGPGFSFKNSVPCKIDSDYLIDYLGVDDSHTGYQELLVWGQKSSVSIKPSENAVKDIFSLGCIIAELYLRRPLFDSLSLSIFLNHGVFPEVLNALPPDVRFIVEVCIQNDWRRRPSAKSILESPYFPATVKSSYLFLAPMNLLANEGSRLSYAANFVRKGALRSMGPFAAEICANFCLPILLNPLSDVEAEWAYILLKEFLKCLKPNVVTKLILPAIQKILQATGYSHLKVLILQDSFVREIWYRIGKQAYLEKMHPFVLSNLFMAPHKRTASAASVLLISSSEELGVPITVHQTILPLIYCFGKGICADGIDALVRIGVVLGENFVVKQILPLLKNVIQSCIDASHLSKPEPAQSWNSLALIDCLMTLDGLISYLPREVVVKELIEDQNCHLVMVLMQSNLELPVLQAAASSLTAVCQYIGPDLAGSHVLPKLKGLFDELAFSQTLPVKSVSVGSSPTSFKPKVTKEIQIESRMELVLLLYPSFASLLGIEKLRQCCTTWLLLEQYLSRNHNWKLEFTGESSRSNPEYAGTKKPSRSKSTASLSNPTKLLMNGVGWSVPQSQGYRGGKVLALHQRFYEHHQSKPDDSSSLVPNIGKCEPWFWFTSPASNWDASCFINRGGAKDEVPWKIRASVIYSARAHYGALRSLSIDIDECTLFTAGVGPGFKGTVQKWDLPTVDCVSGYYGHEEVVNDLCILPSGGRVASCDGTIHIWNSQTGKSISVISETSAHFPNTTNSLYSLSKVNSDQASMLSTSPQASGILTSGFDGSLYTYMHLLDSDGTLVVGTGNGSLRFVDVTCGQKLHMWKSENELGFPSLVSAICSCGSDSKGSSRHVSSPSWIATGLSSGLCKLFDRRSGSVVASWRAHDAYVTKLASPEDHLLVSCSLDRTLRIWDLRRNLPPVSRVFRGHSDGITDFSVWGRDVVSISRNKIGFSSLVGPADEDGNHPIVSRALYSADKGTRNISVLSSISILPYSRLFLVGTEDGHLKICC